jgi:cytochrome b561
MRAAFWERRRVRAEEAAIRASDGSYDPVTRCLHWLNAVLALITIMLAWAIIGAARHSDARIWLIMLHESCGIVILALMLIWAGWRIRRRQPSLRGELSWIELVLARMTQAGIFLLFIAMPISGYVSLAAAGQSVDFFGVINIPPLFPVSFRLSQIAIALHLCGEFLIYGLVGLHISAAMLHGFVRRDGILERMLPRRS